MTNIQPQLKIITNALSYASQMHRFQMRDNGTIPYINHPIEVFHILVSVEVTDTNTLVSALLHDVIEDTEGTYEDIKEKFGKEVADIVFECSDDQTLPKVERKIHQIESIIHKSQSAILVKIADKIANLHSIISGIGPKG